MRTKGLMGFLLATVAAVIVAVFLSTGGGSPAADRQAGAAVLPDIGKRLGDVARVTFVHGDAKTTLLRQGNDWTIEEKSGYPADMAKLRQALLGLAQLRYVEPKTSKPELYARLDVEEAGEKDSKSTLVTVSDEKGQLLGEIIAGKHRVDELGGGVDGLYVRKPGNAQSWLAQGTVDLAGDTVGWLDRKVIDIADDTVKEAVLLQPDGSKLDITRDKPADKFGLKDAPADAKLRSDTVLVEPATALAGLDLTDVRAAADMPSPADGAARAEITTFDGLTIMVMLWEKDGATWARFEAKGAGDAEKQADILNATLSRWVYAIPPHKAAALKTKLADVTAAPKSS